VPVLRPQGAQASAAPDRRAGGVIQAETGGGFGGKEEYPSIIAIHAALLAQRLGRPVRMIYDRHEDLAATTKRHPAIVRHRTGVTRDGGWSRRTSRW
jgi:xanthine dehydrogenase molybdopterin-binding subunit B